MEGLAQLVYLDPTEKKNCPNLLIQKKKKKKRDMEEKNRRCNSCPGKGTPQEPSFLVMGHLTLPWQLGFMVLGRTQAIMAIQCLLHSFTTTKPTSLVILMRMHFDPPFSRFSFPLCSVNIYIYFFFHLSVDVPSNGPRELKKGWLESGNCCYSIRTLELAHVHMFVYIGGFTKILGSLGLRVAREPKEAFRIT